MKYKTHNDKEICTDGTWLQGHVYCSYETLVSLFGEPSERYDDYKCDAHWDVELEDGEVATIYNWKNGINYCGVKDGIPTEKITEWNIGGNTHKVAFAINHLTNHSLMMQVQGLKHNLNYEGVS
jgi:hypothetical protein